MDDRLRLLWLEFAVVAIAEKLGVDLGPVNEEIRKIERRGEEQRRRELRLEEDEKFRRNKIALERAATWTMPPAVVDPYIPPRYIPTPAPANPDRPRA